MRCCCTLCFGGHYCTPCTVGSGPWELRSSSFSCADSTKLSPIYAPYILVPTLVNSVSSSSQLTKSCLILVMSGESRNHAAQSPAVVNHRLWCTVLCLFGRATYLFEALSLGARMLLQQEASCRAETEEAIADSVQITRRR